MQDKSNHETAIVKRLKKYLDPSVFRFLLVGLVNTLFGTAIMFVFYNVFHFGYWFSSASNYVLVSILSYFLNKNYTFRSPVRGWRPFLRFACHISLCYLLAYGIAKPLMNVLLSGASQVLRENAAMLTGMGFFVLINYFGQRFFVFKQVRRDLEIG